MDLSLSENERALAAKARDFCDQVLLPLELETDEHGELPDARRAEVKEAVGRVGLCRHQSRRGPWWMRVLQG